MRAFGAVSSQPALAKARALIQLRQEMQQAMPQRKLVFGEGNPDARLVIVGEAPGRKEEALGRPFAGRAGQLLNQLLAEMSLNREELWITNVVKSRPTQGTVGHVRTRTPSLSEAKKEKAWLERELEVVGPSIILCLGGLAARVLIDSRFRMSVDHGRWHQGPFGAAVLATFHPSYVLRWGKKLDRPLAWLREDMQKVKSRYEELGLMRSK